jgi:hypothetical protein
LEELGKMKGRTKWRKQKPKKVGKLENLRMTGGL